MFTTAFEGPLPQNNIFSVKALTYFVNSNPLRCWQYFRPSMTLLCRKRDSPGYWIQQSPSRNFEEHRLEETHLILCGVPDRPDAFFISPCASYWNPTPHTSGAHGRDWRIDVSQAGDTFQLRVGREGWVLVGEHTWGAASISMARGLRAMQIPNSSPGMVKRLAAELLGFVTQTQQRPPTLADSKAPRSPKTHNEQAIHTLVGRLSEH